ncbi:MAG: Nif11-like leader peptide family RiPP precursor [Lachnospiraceae bacterium]|nr:Nif11-like leader peptide family RiPP precursor [Lachnospiraceae bacterium]
MTQEKVKEFIELVNKDNDLQKKVKAGMDAYTGDKTDERAVFESVLAPIAKEAGFDLSYEDMVEVAKSSGDGELSDEELAAVAGGDGVCFIIGGGFGAGSGGSGVGACDVIGFGFGKWDAPIPDIL